MARELSIGRVAVRSGVAVSALHFYESKGLIASNRTAGNQRRYAPAVLRRLGVIKFAQELGIPLGEIKAALSALPTERAPNKADWAKLSRRWAVSWMRGLRGWSGYVTSWMAALAVAACRWIRV